MDPLSSWETDQESHSQVPARKHQARSVGYCGVGLQHMPSRCGTLWERVKGKPKDGEPRGPILHLLASA